MVWLKSDEVKWIIELIRRLPRIFFRGSLFYEIVVIQFKLERLSEFLLLNLKNIDCFPINLSTKCTKKKSLSKPINFSNSHLSDLHE